MKQTYTTIIHSVRKDFGLSLTEYVVCDTIDRLSNRQNNLWCTLTNQEIADDLGLDERTIRRSIDKLKSCGLVVTSGSKKRTTEGWYDTFKPDKMSESENEKRTKCPEETDKLSEETDKMSALYIYNNNKQSPDSGDKVVVLPQSYGTSPVKRLSTMYAKVLRSKMNSEPVINWGKVGKIFSGTLKHMPELQVAVLLMVHFNYNTDKGDKFLARVLPERMYPIELFANNVNTYKTYLTQEKDIDLTDTERLKEIVYNYLEKYE